MASSHCPRRRRRCPRRSRSSPCWSCPSDSCPRPRRHTARKRGTRRPGLAGDVAVTVVPAVAGGGGNGHAWVVVVVGVEVGVAAAARLGTAVAVRHGYGSQRDRGVRRPDRGPPCCSCWPPPAGCRSWGTRPKPCRDRGRFRDPSHPDPGRLDMWSRRADPPCGSLRSRSCRPAGRRAAIDGEVGLGRRKVGIVDHGHCHPGTLAHR